MKLNTKKGINAVLTVIASLGMATISIAVYAIVVGAFRDSQVASCLNSTGQLQSSCGTAWNISNAGLGIFTGLTSQFNTIGTVSGVLMLVAVMALFGIGSYMAYQKVSE